MMTYAQLIDLLSEIKQKDYNQEVTLRTIDKDGASCYYGISEDNSESDIPNLHIIEG